MKSKSDLAKELNRSYNLKEKVLLEIGSFYFRHFSTNDTQALSSANEKSELLKKIDDRIAELEKDFITAAH
ncbi:MAG TPA: hypothetical protein PLU53_03910 [Bacteroidia bacterium]|nr:hypothetical protein [Bacteroidia bacterium]